MNITLTNRDLDRLLAVIPTNTAFGHRDRVMIILLVHTGLRIGELTGLRLVDVANFQQRTIRTRLVLPAAVCKGRRGRTLPLSRIAQQAVAEILAFNKARGFSQDQLSPLLVNRKHQPLSPRAARRAVETYRRLAGLTGVTPHKFRHLFADRVLHAGGSSRQLQTLLGHRQLNTSEIYTRSRPEELAQLVARL